MKTWPDKKMNVLKITILVVIIGLAISSGLPKIMLIPEEVAFFKSAGLSETLILLLGVIQLISIIILLRKWRKLGAMILGTTFGFSTILLFLNKKISLGLLSFLPIVLIVILVKMKNN